MSKPLRDPHHHNGDRSNWETVIRLTRKRAGRNRYQVAAALEWLLPRPRNEGNRQRFSREVPNATFSAKSVLNHAPLFDPTSARIKTARLKDENCIKKGQKRAADVFRGMGPKLEFLSVSNSY